MTETLKAQAVKALEGAVSFFSAEKAAVSLLGEIGSEARFLAERGNGVITLKLFVKDEGAGFALVETLSQAA